MRSVLMRLTITADCHYCNDLYLKITPPVISGCEEINDSCLSGNAFGNKYLPLPAITGAMQILYSSKRFSLIRVSDKFALPNTYMSLLPFAFSLAISSATFSFIKIELFQSTELSVLEHTILGSLFIKSAISPLAVFQYAAIPS